MKRLIAIAAAAATLAASAQNPIIRDQFTADPTARVFDGKVYLYPSHDIPSPIERLKDWFCMADYHAFSSDNLVDWTDHGVIVTQNEVPWVQPDSYAMWAPDCVEKDGMYYFFFPASPQGMERGFGIGVAIADNPAGPFAPMAKPIKGVFGIDPCVLIDDDGQAYMYWQGMGLTGAKLKDNLLALDGQPEKMQGLPDGFKEGPFAFKRNGIYYLTFPWVRKENGTETLAYATSDKPLGPWTFQGLIMEESPTGCWTNHHSLIEYDGQWYLFYHHNDYSPEVDKRRSARIDKVEFNDDGTIQLVQPTLRGVGIVPARSLVQIDRYSDIGPGASIDYLSSEDRFEGWKTNFDNKGAWVSFDQVGFGETAPTIVKARVRAPKAAVLNVAVKGAKKPLAKLSVPASDEWTVIEAPVTASGVTGVQDLIVTLAKGADVEVDYLQFDDATLY